MRVPHLTLWLAGLAALAIPLIGACSNALAPQADGTVDEGKVYDALKEAVDDDSPEVFGSADDEQAFFGEDEALYEITLPGEFQVAEELIVSEARTGAANTAPFVRPTAHGFLAGKFTSAAGEGQDLEAEQDTGVFRGRWYTSDRQPRGALRGEYRAFAPDELPPGLADGGFFHGKYIDADGQFQGFLRGRYGHTSQSRSLFFGRWYDRHQRLVGVLKGHWIDDPNRGLAALDVNSTTITTIGIGTSPSTAVAGAAATGNAGTSSATDAGRPAGENGEVAVTGNASGSASGNIQVLVAGDAHTIAGRWAAYDVCSETDWLPEAEFADGDFGGYEAVDVTLDTSVAAFDPDDTSLQAEGDLQRGNAQQCVDPDLPFGFIRGWHSPQPQGQTEHDDIPDSDDPTADPNTFRGHWRNSDGTITGVLLGHYEPLMTAEADTSNRATAQTASGTFYGKYLDETGRLRGFIRGTYGHGFHRVGVFRGHYFDADEQEKGILWGRWSNAPETPGGPFFGLWQGEILETAEETPTG